MSTNRFVWREPDLAPADSLPAHALVPYGTEITRGSDIVWLESVPVTTVNQGAPKHVVPKPARMSGHGFVSGEQFYPCPWKSPVTPAAG